jgi:hypothetical protein
MWGQTPVKGAIRTIMIATRDQSMPKRLFQGVLQTGKGVNLATGPGLLMLRKAAGRA